MILSFHKNCSTKEPHPPECRHTVKNMDEAFGVFDRSGAKTGYLYRQNKLIRVYTREGTVISIDNLTLSTETRLKNAGLI